MTHVIEYFEGYVTGMSDNFLWIRYEDNKGREEEAQVIKDKMNIPPEEMEMIELGTIFDWVIFNDGGHLFNIYKEVWTQKDLDEAKKYAEELAAKLLELPQDV